MRLLSNVSEPTKSEVAVGDVLYLHERVTGISKKDRKRWCVVTRLMGASVRVAGRSSTRTEGVPIPKGAMARFTKDGWIWRPTYRISLADAEAAENIGQLDDHLLQQVLFYVNEVVL